MRFGVDWVSAAGRPYFLLPYLRRPKVARVIAESPGRRSKPCPRGSSYFPGASRARWRQVDAPSRQSSRRTWGLVVGTVHCSNVLGLGWCLLVFVGAVNIYFHYERNVGILKVCPPLYYHLSEYSTGVFYALFNHISVI